MPNEPQVVRIVLEDPAGGRQPAPGQRPAWMPPPGTAAAPGAPANRLPVPPGATAGGVPGTVAPNPVLAGMDSQLQRVAEANRQLAAAMKDPTYLSTTLRLAAAQEQQRELVQMQQQLAEKARENLRYGPGGKPLGTDTTDGMGAQADKLAEANAELTGAITNPAYIQNLERLAAAQEEHAKLTAEQNKLAEAARDRAKYPGGKPAEPNSVLAGMGAQADKLAESNRQLAAAMKDPAYAIGQKRLLDLEKERARLGRESQRLADPTGYARQAGQDAGRRVADVGGGRLAQAAAGAQAGGAEGAVAAIGGPVALAMAVKEAADKLKQIPVDLIRAGGSAAAGLADPRGQGLGTIAGAAEGAAKALEKIPIVGDTLGPPAKMLAATFGAANDAAMAFVERGRQLAGMNAELAGAGSRQDVARLMADMREANTMGTGLAKLTDGMTDLETLVREGLLPIKTFLVEVMGDAVKEGLQIGRSILQFISHPENWLVPQAVKDWAKKVLDALDKNQDPSDLIQDWLNAADGLGPMPTIPSGAASDPGMGLPVFTR